MFQYNVAISLTQIRDKFEANGTFLNVYKKSTRKLRTLRPTKQETVPGTSPELKKKFGASELGDKNLKIEQTSHFEALSLEKINSKNSRFSMKMICTEV